MDSAKYIGLDVHRESISIAVLNAAGKIVMECVIETNATLILQFFRGLRGELHVTFEEGTSAAWLYDLIQPHVTESRGVQSSPECPAESRQQERPHRRTEVGGSAARQPAQVGLSR